MIYMSGARSWSRELSLSFADPERRHLLNEIGALRAAIERAELDAVADPGKDVGSKRPMLAI